MKKIISLLVVIVMIATMATTAFAAKAGETVEVKFYAEGNTGFGAYGAVINYPADVLELVEVKAGDLKVEGAMFVANGNKVSYAYPMANAEGDGVLFVATFKIAENAVPGEYVVTATLDTKSTTDISQNPVVFAIKDATVTVEGEHVCAFGEWVVEKEPTCTEAGLEARYCDCGAKETKEIPALGHLFGKWFGVDDYYHAHTCERCDVKEHEAHEWDETGLKCTICGWEKDPNLDPVPGTGDITPVVVTATFAVIALITLAGYMLKRKFAL